MSTHALYRIVGQAVIDDEFSERLLGAEREALLSGFDLSPAEHAAILTIRAETLADFAAKLEQFVLTPSNPQLGESPARRAPYRGGQPGAWAR